MTDSSRTRTSGTRQAVTSFAQDGLWFLDTLTPGSSAHNICRAYRATGSLDIEALRVAWRAVHRRHEILRTSLADVDGRPVQLIAAETNPSPSFVDFSRLPSAERESRVEELCAERAATRFSLAEGPLSQLVVLRLAAMEHCLILVLHRAVADERSMSILVDDLSVSYSAAIEGTMDGTAVDGTAMDSAMDGAAVAHALPVLLVQFADYARWQRDRLAGSELPRLLDWWTSRLTPLPPSPTLPVDRPRPAGPSSHGGVIRFDWGAEPCRRLAELSTGEGTTPFVVLLACFQTLLYRYGDEDRVAVGVPAMARPRPEFEGLIGPFANPLVLCADFSGTPTFRELIGRVARLADDAFAHGELPFDVLVRALNPDRDPRRIPLYDVMFDLPDAPASELRLAGAVVRPQPVDIGSVEADVALTMDQVAPTIAGSLAYRAGLFDPASAQLIVDQLRTLLVAALAEPDVAVDKLALESVDQTRAALREADQIGAGPPAEPVHELVHRWALRRPDAPAVACNGDVVSYRDLEAQAAEVAAALRKLGGVDGSPVAVRVAPGPRQVAVLLGVLQAGAYLVCLATTDTGERDRSVLADLRPMCLVLDAEQVGDDLAHWYRTELGGHVLDIAVLDTAALNIAALDRGPTVPAITVPSRPQRAALIGSADSAALIGCADGRAYVAYTSGSTGRPKGIAQTHGSLAQFVTWLAGQFGIGPGSRVAQWAAAGYDASLCEVFAALVAGATLCPVPQRLRGNPEKLVDWLGRERITHFQTVPTFARELLRVLRSRDSIEPLACLSCLLLAGESLPGELANGLRKTLPWARLVNLYGPTESILATWHEITDDVAGTTPIGGSIPGRQVVILDELDRPCPVGVTGQIVIISPHVTPGYVGAEAEVRSPFRQLRDPAEFGIERTSCYRTGDRGRRRRDGLLEFRGRTDSQIKFYGTRVELTDIEAALAAHDSVAECAVVAVTDRHGLVARLVAYVVARRTPTGSPIGSPDVWRAHLSRRFGRSKLPVSFKTASALARNAGGKVDRRRLAGSGPVLPQDDPTPQTAVEKTVAGIWSELLGVDQISRHDTFFAAGGHSLLVPQVVNRIHTWFGVEVSLWDFFMSPSLADLASLVDSATKAGYGKAVTTTTMG